MFDNYICHSKNEIILLKYIYIRSSEKFLSFYKETMNAQHFPLYITLSNYVWSILFYEIKDHNVRQIRFHVGIKIRCCKGRVCKRKTLSGQPNTYLEDPPIRKLQSDFKN